MNQILIENQIHILLSSDSEKVEELALNLIYFLIKNNDRSNLKLVKSKIGMNLYKQYCNKLISIIESTM